MHHVDVVIYDLSEYSQTRDQRGRNTSRFRESLDQGVNCPGVLHPVVVCEEVKAQDNAVNCLNLRSIHDDSLLFHRGLRVEVRFGIDIHEPVVNWCGDSEPVIRSGRLVELNVVVIVSHLILIQGELRVEVVHRAYWFLPDVRGISEFYHLLKDVNSEESVVEELLDYFKVLAVLRGVVAVHCLYRK